MVAYTKLRIKKAYLEMNSQESSKENGQVLNVLLLIISGVLVHLSNVSLEGDGLCDRVHDNVEEDDKLVIIFGSHLETSDFGQAAQSDVAELGDLQELFHIQKRRISNLHFFLHVSILGSQQTFNLLLSEGFQQCLSQRCIQEESSSGSEEVC